MVKNIPSGELSESLPWIDLSLPVNGNLFKSCFKRNTSWERQEA
jgi:hypothetical protein